MISRYAPSYVFDDLVKSFSRSRSASVYTELSDKLKELYGVKHVFLLDSGKESISVLLKAYDRPGAVLTPAYNCIAVPQAVARAGYYSRFVDARPGQLNVDIDDFIDAITPEVTVLMPVHLFGIPWRMDELYKKLGRQDLLVVEDAAPAFGASLNGQKVGTFGDAFIISFHWTKPVSGETGGAILTHDDDLAQRIENLYSRSRPPRNRLSLFLRTWMRKVITSRGVYPLTHFAYKTLFGEDMYEVVPDEKKSPLNNVKKMSPFSAALILSQLERLESNLARRDEIAAIYREQLSGESGVILPEAPADSQPSWIQYPIMVNSKEDFYKYMQSHNIDVTWSYRYSCPDTYQHNGFKNSHLIASSIIGLPTFPLLSDDDVLKVASLAKKYFTMG